MAVELTASDRIALFKLLVEQANVIAAARRETSRFFLTFNTAVVGGFGYLLANDSTLPRLFLLATASAMIVASMLWFSLLRYYGRIARAKFEVIFLIEEHLEIRPFHLEEQKTWAGGRVGAGASSIESILPILFVLAYLAFAAHLALQPV